MGWSSTFLATAANLLVCAALTGCAGEEPLDNPCGRVYCLYFTYIARSPLHSAYDGVHEYSVVAHVPSAAPDSEDSDPVLAASVKWMLDPAFVAEAEYPDLPAAINLTTKKAGVTTIKLAAQTLSGYSITRQTKLTISEAHADEWSIGDERFHAGVLGARTGEPAPQGEGTCGLTVDLTLPTNYACTNCHDDANSTASENTVIHHEGYTDSDLISIITTGAKPVGGTFESPALRDMPIPDCIFSAIHAWNLSEAEMTGMLWKIRSLPPTPQ